MTAALGDQTTASTPPVAEAPPSSSRKRVIVLAVLAALGAGGAAWVVTHRGLESTDDAQVDAEVVGLCSRASGFVVKVSFEDNEHVEAGRVLAELDPEPAKAKLAQAEASLEGARAALRAAEMDARLSATNAKASNRAASASLSAASAGANASREQIAEARARLTAAESALAQAKTDFERAQKLSQSGALSPSQLDQSKTTLETAEASVAQARAHLSMLESNAAQALSRVGEASARVDQTRDVDSVVTLAEARAESARARLAELEAVRDLAALELSYTKIVAPQAGVASKKNVAVGQMVSAGVPIAQLVSTSKGFWVTANFKETQISKMRAGQPVEIHVDSLPGTELRGAVESFSGATGSRFALLPPDNASGNFTKVVQRVPVRIRFEGLPEAVALRPGLSVELTVDTRK